VIITGVSGREQMAEALRIFARQPDEETTTPEIHAAAS